MEEARQQEKKLRQIISIQKRRLLGAQALRAASLKQSENEAKLKAYLRERNRFDRLPARIQNEDESPLTLLDYVKTDAHDWSPSYWRVASRSNGPKTLSLKVYEVSGDISEPYLVGVNSQGESVAVMLEIRTIIEPIPQSPNFG